jgi:hypothetical protein
MPDPPVVAIAFAAIAFAAIAFAAIAFAAIAFAAITAPLWALQDLCIQQP